MKAWLWLLAIGIVASSPLAFATDANVALSMDASRYSPVDTLAGSPPTATVEVTDDNGEPLAGVEVRLVVLRQLKVVGFAGNETLYATTGADGLATIPLGAASSLPGDYVVLAYAAGSSAAPWRYSVTVA